MSAAYDQRQIRSAMVQSAISPALYLTAFGLAFVWPPAAIAIQVLVLAYFFLRSPIRRVAEEETRESV
jgi:biopolymer transport protein ExbB/TolQ